MIYVGVDIAKLNHCAAIMDSNGQVLQSPFMFTNNSQGFNKLLSNLKPFDKSNLVIGVESTSNYAENLINYFFDLGSFALLCSWSCCSQTCSCYL